MKISNLPAGGAKRAILMAVAWFVLGAGNVQCFDVAVDDSYLASGSKTHGKVLFDAGDAFPADAIVKVEISRRIDVSTAVPEKSETTLQPVVKRGFGELAGATSLPFEMDSAGILFGELQVKAEVRGADNSLLAVAWSKPAEVGIRHRIDLAGAWNPSNVRNLEYTNQWRPQNWKLPAFDRPIALPGTITPDDWFRGWVTLTREAQWSLDAKFQPRFLHLSGVSNSALAKIDGVTIGEVQTVEELDFDISHWQEFSSPYKGDENRTKRHIMGDSEVLPPMTMPLPKALVAEGKAAVELTIRGTSGGINGKPPYGIFGDLFLEATPNVYIKSVSFDATKPGEKRLFKFALTMVNESGVAFTGKLHSVYGRYSGDLPYTGACPSYASSDLPVSLPPGESIVEVDREEMPRFDTCRAAFLLKAGNGDLLDAATQDFHTTVVEIRNRREIYLNNERFIVKFQGSIANDANSRFNFRITGANGIRGHQSVISRRFPGLRSSADQIDERYKDGLLQGAGSALLASCERCIFWNPKDTSNITRAVKKVMRDLSQCPGILYWEATNELFAEPDEARIAIQEAFHKLDPYHRPIVATKGSGEWEAVAKDGAVPGVDIVGCQYLLNREAIDSVTAAITQQPLMCTEVNWNDPTMLDQNVFETWLDKGLAGVLLFDYSGFAMQQPVPLIPGREDDRELNGQIYRQRNRQMLQDITPTAVRLADGRIRVNLGNRMPYKLKSVEMFAGTLGKLELPDFESGDVVTVVLPASRALVAGVPLPLRLEYTTHAGLKHVALLTAVIAAEKVEASK